MPYRGRVIWRNIHGSNKNYARGDRRGCDRLIVLQLHTACVISAYHH